jgi:hypothetical protein
MASAEPVQDVQVVGPLGRGRQRHKNPRSDMIQEPTVAWGRGVMELVHDDVLVLIRRLPPEFSRVVTLNRTEQVSGLLGLPAPDQKVAKVLVPSHAAEGAQRLPQDLLPVGDE